MIRRTVGQRRRNNDVSIAGAEEENSSGPDDPTPVGVMRRTIRWLLRQLSEAQRIHQGLERLDDPTLPDRMFRRLRRKRGNDSKGLIRLGGL